MAAAVSMPVTEIEAYEDDKRFHFDVLSLTFQGSSWLGSTKNWPDLPEIVQQHIVVFYQTVRLLQKLLDSGSNVNAYDKETLGKVSWTWSNK